MTDEPLFWVQRLVFAYQGPKDIDFDPDSELGLTGRTVSPSPLPSAIYLETIRDILAGNGTLTSGNLAIAIDATIAHEMGHTPGVGHMGVPGIMVAGGHVQGYPEPLYGRPPVLDYFQPSPSFASAERVGGKEASTDD